MGYNYAITPYEEELRAFHLFACFDGIMHLEVYKDTLDANLRTSAQKKTH